jgi:phosphohistidine phosphatase
MILYVMRHAEAVDQTASGTDEERYLTPRGRDRTRDAGKGLRALGLRFDAILTSPLKRAVETAELVASAYPDAPALQVVPALASGVGVRELLPALAGFTELDDVLIVGHEPQLSRLVATLLTRDSRAGIRLKKGGCVALDQPNGFEPGGAELLWMLTQRHLRKLRRS